MAIIIKDLYVQQFRGLRELSITNLNHVNIIVGDNNSGKTSVLESLLLLRNPESLVNIIRATRQRELPPYRIPIYENFINFFSKNNSTLSIQISTLLESNNIMELRLSGNEKQIILDSLEISPRMRRNAIVHNIPIQEKTEVFAFDGMLYTKIGEKQNNIPVFLHELTQFSGMTINQKDYLKLHYSSPFDHLIGNNLSSIIRNDDYKNLCINILKLFDSDITDLLILRNEQTNAPVEYVKHKILGNMPLSTYGDGIKKVLSIANSIARSTNGILLIDEVETAIHSKYYDEIFSFLTLASKKFNVQLFLTTHNIEAIDGLLSTQNYDSQNSYDDINVITIKKTADKTFSRILPGRQVAKNREDFCFEVRI